MIGKIFLVVFVALAICAIGYAAPEKADATKADQDVQAKNMTYGECVSENAAIKNTCYNTAKQASLACKSAATNSTTKGDVKQCNQAYSKDKKVCKDAFKASKKECAKIKHNVFETAGSAFK